MDVEGKSRGGGVSVRAQKGGYLFEPLADVILRLADDFVL